MQRTGRNSLESCPKFSQARVGRGSVPGIVFSMISMLKSTSTEVTTFYLWQGLKLQYERRAELLVAMLDGGITEAEHERLVAENTLIRVMLTEPAAVWAVD